LNIFVISFNYGGFTAHINCIAVVTKLKQKLYIVADGLGENNVIVDGQRDDPKLAGKPGEKISVIERKCF